MAFPVSVKADICSLQPRILIRGLYPVEVLLNEAAEVNRWRIQELAIQPDHVHLLLQIQPTASIASVMKSLKGGTSHVLREEFPELKEFLWGRAFGHKATLLRVWGR